MLQSIRKSISKSFFKISKPVETNTSYCQCNNYDNDDDLELNDQKSNLMYNFITRFGVHSKYEPINTIVCNGILLYSKIVYLKLLVSSKLSQKYQNIKLHNT